MCTELYLLNDMLLYQAGDMAVYTNEQHSDDTVDESPILPVNIAEREPSFGGGSSNVEVARDNHRSNEGSDSGYSSGESNGSNGDSLYANLHLIIPGRPRSTRLMRQVGLSLPALNPEDIVWTLDWKRVDE